ncbi:MAG: alpha-glucosidase [Leptospirales bacterium]|nr:alpha-glucosidase [Leptospirales bacterium]
MKHWWKEAVIYQIYPRSFQDSNGDGVGDISGIQQRLTYLKDLGVDALWISPINVSPMFDFGYDISDYRAIDPQFGTMKDFDSLIKAARKLDLKILMDLVVNHTSHLHPWFIESRSSKNNPKRDWYIWQPGKKGQLPNNWKSVFGGSAWEWDESTESYFLHSFLSEQPDLNWRNPAVKKQIFSDVEFWLKRGVAGFRLDVVNLYFKDALLRNNPPRFWGWQYPRPYELQYHTYDMSQPEMHPLLRDLRKLLDKYKAMSVGEVFGDYPGDPNKAASYLGNFDELHLAFDFTIMFQKWSSDAFATVMRNWMRACGPENWPSLVLNNHDQGRSYSRYASGKNSDARAKLLATLLLTSRGTPFLYYGEELGMKDGTIARHQLKDPVGIRYWPLNPGRDPQRTPMPWDGTDKGGFTSGDPWLPLNDDTPQRNVAAQLADPESLLSWHKKLIRLRKESPALRLGTWAELEGTSANVFGYIRQHDKDKKSILLNFADRPQVVSHGGTVVLSTHRKKGDKLTSSYELQPYEAIILQ